MNPERLTWRETFARLRADHRRLIGLLATRQPRAPVSAYFSPSFVCVFLYRMSNHLYRSGHRWSARAFWHLNVLLTGADISEPSNLGPGLVVLHPPGTSIMGAAGQNFTVMACCGVGGELGRRDDVGAWPGVPVIGDDVVLEPHCGVAGPIRVGHRVRVGAGTFVSRDVPDDTFVEGPRPRFLARRDLPEDFRASGAP